MSISYKKSIEFKLLKKSFDRVNVDCKYDKDEYSLYTLGCNTDGSFVINKTYLSLDFNIDSKEVLGISGFIGDLYDLPSIDINGFTVKADAILIFDADEAFKPGIGYNFNYDGKVLYDAEKKCLCVLPIDKKTMPDEFYRISKNIFVALNNSMIECIIIRLE